MENLQDLKHKIFDHATAAEEALISLDKAITILNHWTNEYCYNRKPEPMAAIVGGSTIGGSKDAHQIQSGQWFNEYESIVQYIEIVFDYVCKAKSELAGV